MKNKKSDQHYDQEMPAVEKTVLIQTEQSTAPAARENTDESKKDQNFTVPLHPDKTLKIAKSSLLKEIKSSPVSGNVLDRTAKISTIQTAEYLKSSKTSSSTTFFLRGKIKKILTYRFFESHSSVDIKIAPGVANAEGKTNHIDQNAELHGELQNINATMEIRNTIAEGGQGILSTAKDLPLNRLVAVKSLKKEFLHDPEQRNRFITEAKVTAQLDHPSIVPIYTLATDDEKGLHLAMKKLQGITLQEYLEQISRCYSMDGVRAYDEQKSIHFRLDMFLRICDAIAYAHSRNVLHCDLKPENIMIGEYHEAYVMDWGIAHPIRSEEYNPETWVRPSTISGTPRFLAPEVIAGELPDERADVFALGLILFEIVTLQPAFSGKDNDALMTRILDGKMASVKHLYRIKIDADLEAIIHKACATDRRKRYQNVAELSMDIRRYFSGAETTAKPDSSYGKITRFIWRNRRTASLVFALVLLAMVSTLCFMLYEQMQYSRNSQSLEYTASKMFGNCTSKVVSLDKSVRRVESLLQNAAAVTMLRLLSAEPMRESRFYSMAVFNKRELYPEHMIKSPIYQHFVDFQAMVYLKPMQDDKTREHGLKVASLMSEYRKILLRSSVPEKIQSPDFEALERKAIHRGIPILRIYLGFPDGQFYLYPAVSRFPENYDVLTRFWYKGGMNNKNGTLVWSQPYLDIWPENGPVLTCYMPLKHEKNHGVIALDLSLKNMALDNRFQANESPYLLERALLDAKGRVLISTDPENNPNFEGDQPEDTLDIRMYDNGNIAKQILEKKIGIIRDFEKQKNVAYVFHQMQTLDWIYVEKIDLDQQMAFFSEDYELQEKMKKIKIFGLF